MVALKPDALIMADPGLIMMMRETYSEMPIHLSVQANTLNYAAVKFWQKMGVERVILSRELSLDEIAEIRPQCSDVELEVFVHGALCIAYSGRCLLSGYFLIIAIQIKERVPILAAGNTTRNLLKKIRRVIGFRLKIVTFYQ